MKKKLIGFLIAGILAVPVATVCAEVRQVPVTATVSGTYTVSLPTGISIGADRTAQYQVKVYGDVEESKVIRVTPASSFDLTRNSKTVSASVSQEMTEWNYDAITAKSGGALVGTATTGTISAPNLTAGSWTGTLDFTISVE